VSFRVEKAEDLGPVKELIQLAYENARTKMVGHRTRVQSKLG
jgi:hypothetical protein